MATDISALICEQAFDRLKAPIKLVTAPHCPVPFTPMLEDLYLPSPDKIEAAVRSILGRNH
jgi:pyruvate dehydrogenase E1 component beta subunit